MGWKDDPLVGPAKPKWQSDTVISPSNADVTQEPEGGGLWTGSAGRVGDNQGVPSADPAIAQRDFSLMLDENPELKKYYEDRGNPYLQDDTVYDPLTGVPYAGSFMNTPMTTKTSALQGVKEGAKQGATFGLSDEVGAAVAALMGGDHSTELANRRQFIDDAKESGGFGIGSAMGSLLPGSIGAKWAGKAAGLGGKMLRGAVYGGGQGAAYGFGEGEGGAAERSRNAMFPAAVGATLGAGVPLAGAGIKWAADNMPFTGTGAELARMAEGAPTTEQAKKVAKEVLEEAGQMGQTVPQDQFPGLKIINDFSDKLDTLPGQTSTPGGIRLAENINTAAANPGGVSPELIKKLRESASELSADLSPTFTPTRDARVGASAVGAIDDFIATLPEGTTYKQGLDLWKKYLKSKDIDRIAEKAGNYLSNETGGVRNMLKSLLSSDKRSRTYTSAEQDMLRRIIKGTPVENVLRTAGSGLGRLFGAGAGIATAGNPVVGGMAGYGASSLAQSGADAITMRNLEIARALLAKGGMTELPQMPKAVQAIIEALMRRGSVAGVIGGQQ